MAKGKEEMVVKTLSIPFVKERDTKRFIRFKEESDNPVIGTLYIRKDAVPAGKEKVTVTLTFA
mgnify:CR=1 FL=1